MIPTFFCTSRPDLTLAPIAGKRTAGSCGLSTKMMVHVSRYAGTRAVPGDEKPPRFCLHCKCRAFANLRAALLAAFSRPTSRCYPWSYRPPLLRLCCTDGTSSAQRTISIVSLHIQTVHGEDARTGGRTAYHRMLQGGTVGRGGRHSAERSCQGACRY
jgi:hypothetical protein